MPDTAPTAPDFDVDARDRASRGGLRVLVATEHVNATCIISFQHPLAAMRQRGELDFVTLSEKWVPETADTTLADQVLADVEPSVVVFSRFSRPWGLTLRQAARARDIPVVYHIDDDLLNLPESLGAAVLKRHGNPEVVGTRRALLASADLIYASTARLAERMQREFPTARVHHGMYAAIRETAVARRRDTPPTIGYMGSRGHALDLALIVPALTRLMDERRDLRFEVFGTIAMPEPLERFGQRIRSHPVLPDYDAFLDYLGRLPWTIGLAPLEDTAFNGCKAPTKFIEYTGAGIPVVASAVPVYAEVIEHGRSGWLSEDTTWYDVLTSALDQDRLDPIGTEALRTCHERFGPERLQQQLRDVFELARASSAAPVA